MPRRTRRRVIESRCCGRVWTAGGRWILRRQRRDVVLHAIHRRALTLATIVSLVVSVSGDNRSPSSTMSEDMADTVRLDVTKRDADADHGPSPAFYTGVDNMPPSQVRISDSDNIKNGFMSGDKQSVSLSLFTAIRLRCT